MHLSTIAEIAKFKAYSSGVMNVGVERDPPLLGITGTDADLPVAITLHDKAFAVVGPIGIEGESSVFVAAKARADALVVVIAGVVEVFLFIVREEVDAGPLLVMITEVEVGLLIATVANGACRFDFLIAGIGADIPLAVCTEIKVDSLVVPPGSKVGF